LAESNLFSYHLWSYHAILYLRKHRGIQIRELAVASEKQMIITASAGSGPPVFHPLLETAIAVLEDGRKFAFTALSKRLAVEENNCLIALSSISGRS
jgi:hypothetical protein